MLQAHDEAHDVYIGAGSNVGKRLFHLDAAVCGLSDIGTVVQCSPVYETEPVGYLDQGKFLNMVVHLRTNAKPREILGHLSRLEQEAGRERTIRFGPRTLDLDILLYDNEYYCVSDLQIPHPRMWERAFVIVPLADMTPDRPALGGIRMAELARSLQAGDEVRYVGRFW
ncbi:2-amino-4-hydroxy-6-hydroxymethyldihydropteridine diphosphokinase [Alicyclobacillus hesperidum subsp. aegles]|uniref:2-amino-4-hydroxy-6-hydroxymethyldihydropteridine diphosphokinase n=1 Tax=Alicyclobacillus hesperidum TaxID=89784 RepID=A0A1H2TKJ5_9BACL|nr:2-amino-4-hydroxy-6-hydroxymethyldihydropteridine diphosphokinase [Alicyclobacillus hesperidum]GLG02371.1 2-amino-4-hydroxy-6-hydroxymethyldihydropteridine diphosphokinase [Alicyclobacillus hesperidum subsp. aegles]GLV13886.1 2-amino-4-hydroxy-6-hydroxymethyldihydropteridine diphosphokinase [Alicyclobacillus hesperidum]SDW44536.1 2-amino-4-hydroxy-6-hydroxymethyldihydropteridinediphosphokinase [Alicyclobacillus hesperidum]